MRCPGSGSTPAASTSVIGNPNWPSAIDLRQEVVDCLTNGLSRQSRIPGVNRFRDLVDTTHVGLEAPKGKEANWVPTAGGRRYFL